MRDVALKHVLMQEQRILPSSTTFADDVAVAPTPAATCQTPHMLLHLHVDELAVHGFGRVGGPLARVVRRRENDLCVL